MLTRTFGDCFFVSALDMLHIFHRSLVLAVPVFQIGTLWVFFPPVIRLFHPSFSASASLAPSDCFFSLFALLLVTVHATFLFSPLASFLLCILQS